MLLATGWLDSSGTPRLCINLSGPQSERKEFNGVIDTGFDGFITLPEQEAYQLGMERTGSVDMTLADASEVSRGIAVGRAELGQNEKLGICILEQNSSEVLIGMEFFKLFEAAILISPSGVSVIHQDHCNHPAASPDTPGRPTTNDALRLVRTDEVEQRKKLGGV